MTWLQESSGMIFNHVSNALRAG